MTKEPKIEAGKRIVAEWSALDTEARALVDRLRAQDEEEANAAGGKSAEKSGAAVSGGRDHDEL